ncbi:MAG: Hsp20 family protein, partial [Pseudomonadota bacterium]
TAIGIDRMANLFDNSESQSNYPPYNIEVLEENRYQITMAVAGFLSNEIDITTEQSVLKIIGRKDTSEDKQYLYQGIAFRNFERKFQLADYVKVTHAQLENGLLSIRLEREIPEALKPRKISINVNDSSQLKSLEDSSDALKAVNNR